MQMTEILCIDSNAVGNRIAARAALRHDDMPHYTMKAFKI